MTGKLLGVLNTLELWSVILIMKLKKTKAGFLAANKACYFLQDIFITKQIHRNNET